MSVTPWLPTVTRINDGDSIDQGTLNTPIDQLTQRDQHLYDKFAQMANKSVLVVTDQPIHPKATFTPGELSLAYYKKDSDGEGLDKGKTGFSSSSSSTMFTPSISNYTFGLVKSVNTSQKTTDLFIEGLCDLDVPLNDATLGLIQKNASGTVEDFAVGPYYLSNKSPGKITNNPSGIPVYVGYAISTTKFLLHTNVDEFSQFFINYRYHILDRVAGVPSFSNGLWTISSVDLNALGWVPATGNMPDVALFRYNIPSADILNSDGNTTSIEEQEALELAKNLPPLPANFNQLYADGLLIRYKDFYDTGGKYSIDAYGIWWYSNKINEVPWSQSYPLTSNAPANWTAIKTTLNNNNSRKNVFLSFSKFNPALRTQLVSSLTPLNTSASNVAPFIQFYSKDNPSLPSVTGDLLVDINAPVNETGYAATEGAAVASQTYPTATSPKFTSNRAVAGIVYSKPDGAFKAAITPVVAQIIGSPTITVTETTPNSGKWQIDYMSNGSVGLVDSIEPINARLEFRGLSSYIKLPPTYTTKYGFIGKILLPQGSFSSKNLNIVFHLFGDQTITGANSNVTFNFSYSTVSAVGGVNPVLTNTIVGSAEPIPTPVTFSMGASYTAYTSLKVSPSLTIPGTAISEDSIINFQITRAAPSASAYAGNIGVLATYWTIPLT